MFSACPLLLLLLQLLMSRAHAKPQTTSTNGVVDARLVNGGRRCSGLLEMKHQGQWRTLMLRSNIQSSQVSFAEVACRQMGCGSVVSFKVNTKDPKPAWEVYFPCHGHESTIRECKEGASRKKVDDVDSSSSSMFVECSDFLGLTNTISNSFCSGKVRMKSGLNWVHVCETERPGNQELMVQMMCAELGCGLDGSPKHVSVKSSVESRIIRCQGNETQLEDCPTSAHSNCTRVLSIDCTSLHSVRLVGESRCRGVLEGKNGMEWRPLINGWIRFKEDYWMFLCKAMGCGTFISSAYKYYDQTQRIWMTQFECNVNSFCGSWRNTDGQTGLNVACTEAVRLVDKQDKCIGTVEVKHKGEWRKLCHKDFTPLLAFVGCRDLSCGFPRELPKSFFRHTVRNALSLNCSGQEEHLVDCPESSLPAEGTNEECNEALLTCESTPTAPEVTMFSRLANNKPEVLVAYDGHRVFITCSVDSPVPIKSCLLKFSTMMGSELVGNQSAVDNAAQFVFEAELTQNGSYHCTYDYGFSPNVISERTAFYLYVKESLYARLTGEESHCFGSLELEHEGEWRPLSQQQWGLKEAAVVCRQLHCGSAISTHIRSYELQPVWRFFSDCDGSERALLDCGSITKWLSPTTVHVLCSDIVAPPSITVLADKFYPENTKHVVLYEGQSFIVNCSVEPRFPGGHFSLAFSGSKKLKLTEASINYWTVFQFSQVTSDDSGIYSCSYHNTISQHNFTFESKTVTITVNESGYIMLDDGQQRNDGSKSCSGTLFMRNGAAQMKMVTVETSAWDMRHASIVCRQLECGNAVFTSKIQLQTSKPMWRFFSDCNGFEASLLECGRIEEWFSSMTVQVACAGNS